MVGAVPLGLFREEFLPPSIPKCFKTVLQSSGVLIATNVAKVGGFFELEGKLNKVYTVQIRSLLA